jgi:hypothetical protein
MNTELLNSIFLSIFQNLSTLTQNNEINYKKIDKNPLYNPEQVCFSYNFTNDNILSLNFEIIICNQTLNKIYVISKSILLKNLLNETPVIIEKITYNYSELNNVNVVVKIENFHINIYVQKLDENNDNIFYNGIINYYTH